MPLALPNLDDRRWTDLIDEARALIPVLAPSWTDQNPSEPGITLIELLAFIAEQDIYRLNRISPRHRALMLSMAGVVPRGPQPARALLQFGTGTAGGVNVAAGAECTTGEVRYRTLEAAHVVPGAIDGILAAAPGELQDLSFALRRRGRAWLFGPGAASGATLYLGLSALPSAGPLHLGFHFAGPRTDAAERFRIAEEHKDIPPHHSVRLQWAASTSGGWRDIADTDGTRALTLDGAVRLQLPANCAVIALGGVAPRFWLRCTLISGAYDRPPELKQVFLNAAAAEQASASDLTPIGASSGDPFQIVKLPGGMVVKESVSLWSEESGHSRLWERVDDFAASRPASQDFLLRADTGEIQLGDGNQGRLAAVGSAFTASYRNTKGAAGAAGAGTINRLATAQGDLTVTNPAASQGGADGETLTAAIGRAIEQREASLRAVTIDDIRTLALETPGALVARAEVQANHYPGLKCVTAHGVITVIVLPEGSGPSPVPSPGLLALVARRLERARIVGTRIIVIGPHYVEVSVRATLKGSMVTAAELRARAKAALDTFFHPLTGGAAGGGWPLGRDVYRSEVLQVLDSVPGVDYVAALEITANQCPATCGNLCLEPLALAASGAHEIEVL
jgi:predicted phage baseplate assembly protein